MLINARSRLRDGAIGFALGTAVTGLLQALGTLGILVMLSRSLDPVSWGWPRLATSVSLLVFGVAGGLAWASARGRGPAAVLAFMSALGVVGAALWTVQPTVEVGMWAAALRQLAFAALLAVLVGAAGWAWSRASSGPVRVVDVALGAVVGMAATRLGDVVETALYLDGMSSGEQRVSIILGVVGGAVLTIAALLAVVALAGRLPVVAVASLVVIAGVLLAVVVVRDATLMEIVIVSANDRRQLAVLVGLASGAGQALLALGLGAVIVAAGLRATRSHSECGSAEASAERHAPTP